MYGHQERQALLIRHNATMDKLTCQAEDLLEAGRVKALLRGINQAITGQGIRADQDEGEADLGGDIEQKCTGR